MPPRPQPASLAHAPATPPVPPELAAWIWPGASGLGGRAGLAGAQPAGISTGQAVLDAELPGGGWPTDALSEVLIDEPAACEWRLLAPALRRLSAAGRPVFLMAPPHRPLGLSSSLGQPLIWVQARTPEQALWSCEQVLKSGVAGALVAWLPQVKPAALRRLQACAQAGARLQSADPRSAQHTRSAPPPSPAGCLAFIVRPLAAQHESSPAALRVAVSLSGPGSLRLRIIKRRGPVCENELHLPAWPDGLEPLLSAKLTPRSGHRSSLQPLPAANARASGAAPTAEAALTHTSPLRDHPVPTEVPYAALAGLALPDDSAA